MSTPTKKFTVAVSVLIIVFGAVLMVEFSQRYTLEQALITESESRVTQKEFRVPLDAADVPLSLPEPSINIDDLASKRIMGGVVPHHLLASDFLAEFFQLIANRSGRPKTIVLLSPNHFESGEANIQTTDVLWRTPYGSVEMDTAVLQRLLETTTAKAVPESFEAEHGIYNIVPYIAHFLPETRIVPIILRHDSVSEEISTLVHFLQPLVEQGEVFVIGSVDFSHYLSKAESDRKDEETLRAMENYDVSRIARFENDHLDSPATILTLLQTAQATGMGDIRTLRHDNSADGTRGSHDSTTSHFTLVLMGSETE